LSHARGSALISLTSQDWANREGQTFHHKHESASFILTDAARKSKPFSGYSLFPVYFAKFIDVFLKK